MEQMKTTRAIGSAGGSHKRLYVYLLMNILLFLILPLVSILTQIYFEQETPGWVLIGKWFVFWAVGIRLFIAGISQSSNPAFTAGIFQMKTKESFVVIRELGFANISLGVMGILSVINDNWRAIAAITGALFFGLAGIQHLFKEKETGKEWIAMVGDLFVAIVLMLYLLFTTIL
jgi:hypothetical protein